MKQNSHQNDASGLLNTNLLIGAKEKFIDLHGKQTVVTSQVGVDFTLTQATASQSV